MAIEILRSVPSFLEAIMKFLPFQEFNVVVNLPPWEVCRWLLENVGGTSPFRGDVQESTFKIYRNIFYSDAYLPRLHGVLEPVDGGTKIKIRMKLFLLTKLYILAVILLIIGLNLAGKLNYIEELAIVVLLFFIYFIALRFEEKESRQAFMTFLEAHITANHQVVQ